MGGHGGLNILPQKRWNVYNYENREKVRKDEEAAAKEEQLKREQSRKRDTEYRIEQLRTARGLAPKANPASASEEPTSISEEPASVIEPEPESRHINLFEGVKIFYINDGAVEGKAGVEMEGNKKKKMKKEEKEPRVVTAEDEKYRLGYGIAGKGVKLPWYLARPSDGANGESGGDNDRTRSRKEGNKSGGKKTIQELREERLRREKREKERERALVREKSLRDRAIARDRGFSRR